MSATTGTGPSRGRGRRIATGILGVLAVVAITLASLVGAVHSVVLSPDKLAQVVSPIVDDPEVRAVIASRAANGIVEGLGVEARAENLLGDRIGPVMAPVIAQGVTDRLAQRIEDRLATDTFAARWDAIVGVTTQSLVNVLKGDSEVVTTSDGTVYLNLLPLVGETLTALQAQGIIDPSVQLPDLSDPADAPGAIGRLGAAIGTKLPETFGQVPLAETSALAGAQSAVAAFDLITLLLIVAAIVLTVAAVWLAADRLRAVVLIGIAAGLLLALIPPLLRVADQAIVSMLASADAKVLASALVGAVIEAVSWSLRVVALACLAVALLGMTGGPGMRGFRAIADRPSRAAPLAIGAVAFVAAWIVLGSNAAVLSLALVEVVVYASGRRIVAVPAAPVPDIPAASPA
jgi:hypothetical protein